MSESIYSGSNEETPDEPHASMSSLASYFTPFFAPAPTPVVANRNPAGVLRLESVAFTHALVALAAKLAAVDGTPNTAEYAAFHALFAQGDAVEAAQQRSMFVRRVTDSSTALQYARQIAGMTQGQSALHRDLMGRLVQVATADGALNAAEIELLRAVADVLGVARETFRTLVGQTVAPVSTSPYDILGATTRMTDAELRERYMAKVQKLHPDRYQAAGASGETIALLSDQLAAVNAAYQTVQKLRAKKSPRPTGDTAWWQRKPTKGAVVKPT